MGQETLVVSSPYTQRTYGILYEGGTYPNVPLDFRVPLVKGLYLKLNKWKLNLGEYY